MGEGARVGLQVVCPCSQPRHDITSGNVPISTFFLFSKARLFTMKRIPQAFIPLGDFTASTTLHPSALSLSCTSESVAHSQYTCQKTTKTFFFGQRPLFKLSSFCFSPVPFFLVGGYTSCPASLFISPCNLGPCSSLLSSSLEMHTYWVTPAWNQLFAGFPVFSGQRPKFSQSPTKQ